MNKLLDLEEVVYENKKRERNRLAIFESVIDQCHSQIRRYNKEHKTRTCLFSVPVVMPGRPPYDFEVLVNYLLYHLMDNGLHAQFMPDTNQIYISWRDEDLDIEKYEQRKNRIKNSHSRTSVFGVSSAPPEIPIRPSHRRKTAKVIDMTAGTANVFNDDFGPVNRQKYQNAKRLQQQREEQFKESVQSKKVATKSFDDFMRTF